jgi:hypothetical protein
LDTAKYGSIEAGRKAELPLEFLLRKSGYDESEITEILRLNREEETRQAALQQKALQQGPQPRSGTGDAPLVVRPPAGSAVATNGKGG